MLRHCRRLQHVVHRVRRNSAESTSAFWDQQGASAQAALPGSWKAAFWLAETTTLYVYATDTRILSIDVFATNGGVPTAADLSAWQQFAEGIAPKLVATLGSE